MELIKCEVYKIFSQKIIYIVLFIFIVLYILYFNSGTSVHAVNKEVLGWVNIIGFNFQIGYYFIGGLTIIGLTTMFSREYTSRMDRLIFSSKHGRMKLVFAKMVATLIYVSFITLLFSCVAIFINGTSFGLKGWNLSLMQIDNFYFTTIFEGTILNFYIIQQLYTIFGSFLFGLFIIFLSTLTRRTFMPIIGGLAVFLMPDIMLNGPLTMPVLYNLFIYQEYIALEYLGVLTLPYVQLMGMDLYYEQYLLLKMILLLIISTGAIFYSVRRRQVL